MSKNKYEKAVERAFEQARRDGRLCLCSWSHGPDGPDERLDNPDCRMHHPVEEKRG